MMITVELLVGMNLMIEVKVPQFNVERTRVDLQVLVLQLQMI